MPQKLKIAWVIGTLALALFAAIPARAATLTLNYALGFNGYFRLGTWTPLSVTLENRGRATRGTLEVLVTSGSEFLQTVHRTVYAAELELPYNSTTLATFTIHLSSFTHDLLIRLRDGDEILASAIVSLRAKYTDKPLVVVLDERITPDFLSVLPAERFAVNALPRFLPDTVFGYDGVAMLIVNADVLGSLREPQFQALQGWLRQGGFLVTSGSMNYGVFQEARWQHIMPLRIAGHREFTELSVLTEFCGQPLISDRPFLVLQAALPGGEVVLTAGDTPLLTIQPIGAGRIVFLAVDLQHPPFSRWPGRPAFWERVMTLRPEGMPVTLAMAKQPVLDALLQSMPAGFPDRWLAFGFLGVYLILFEVVTASFGKRNANNRRILGLVFGLILVFSAGGYGLFVYPAQKQDLAYDSLLHVHASGNNAIAYGEFMLGVFGLKNTTYTVGFGDAAYPIKPILPTSSYRTAPTPYVLYQTEAGQRIQGELAKWSYGFFTMTTPIDFRLRAKARHDAENGLELGFENPTPHALNDVYGYFAGRLFALGTIAAESTIVKTLSMTSIQEQELFDVGRVRALIPAVADEARLPFWQRMQRELLKYVLTLTNTTYNGREDVVILVGWMPSSSIETRFEHSGYVGASATLVTWAIPVE